MKQMYSEEELKKINDNDALCYHLITFRETADGEDTIVFTLMLPSKKESPLSFDEIEYISQDGYCYPVFNASVGDYKIPAGYIAEFELYGIGCKDGEPQEFKYIKNAYNDNIEIYRYSIYKGNEMIYHS